MVGMMNNKLESKDSGGGGGDAAIAAMMQQQMQQAAMAQSQMSGLRGSAMLASTLGNKFDERYCFCCF